MQTPASFADLALGGQKRVGEPFRRPGLGSARPDVVDPVVEDTPAPRSGTLLRFQCLEQLGQLAVGKCLEIVTWIVAHRHFVSAGHDGPRIPFQVM